MITDEILNEKRTLLEGQKQDAFAVFNQAIGAIGVIDHLKTLINEKDHLTISELEKAVGGKVESIDPV